MTHQATQLDSDLVERLVATAIEAGDLILEVRKRGASLFAVEFHTAEVAGNGLQIAPSIPAQP